MKGLELSERFYLEYGAPMIRERFPELEDLIAVGLVGCGSECLGYDDEISTDHDFEPGFCMFIPDSEDFDERTEFALEREYARLPKEFCGFSRSLIDPVGGSRHGVVRISDFLSARIGSPDGRLRLRDWVSLSDQSLSEITNGRLFRDTLGLFTAIRERLAYFPEDARLKRLAGHLLLMGQSGQYNYGRSVVRGESAAAQLAVTEYVKSALAVIFLLNRRYLPYYKWSFRALRELPILSELHDPLEYLISSGNSPEEVSKKTAIVERVCGAVASELRAQGLTGYAGDEAEGHAYSVNDRIVDHGLRNLSVLFAV